MVFDIPFQNESLFRYESLKLYVFRWKHEAMTKKIFEDIPPWRIHGTTIYLHLYSWFVWYNQYVHPGRWLHFGNLKPDPDDFPFQCGWKLSLFKIFIGPRGVNSWSPPGLEKSSWFGKGIFSYFWRTVIVFFWHMYVYMYTYLHIFFYLYTYVYICIITYIYIYMYIHIYVYTNMYMYSYTMGTQGVVLSICSRLFGIQRWHGETGPLFFQCHLFGFP